MTGSIPVRKSSLTKTFVAAMTMTDCRLEYMLKEPDVAGSNPAGAIASRRAVAQWQSAVKLWSQLRRSFDPKNTRPTAGAEYMAK